MSSGGAPMNAAALPLPRVMPGTGHFGWDCLSGGRRLKVKAVTGANSWQLVARIERSEILVRPVPDCYEGIIIPVHWWRILAKRTNFGIPNEINAVRLLCALRRQSELSAAGDFS